MEGSFTTSYWSGRDRFALLPDRSAHCAVAVDGIVGPIAARVGEVKPAGKSSGHNFETELAGKQLRVALDAFEIARAAMKQEKAGFFSIGAERNSLRVFRLVYDHPQVPIQTEDIDTEDVFSLPDRDIGYGQDCLQCL